MQKTGGSSSPHSSGQARNTAFSGGDSSTRQVHQGVACDNCGLKPIRGSRFHSLVSMLADRRCCQCLLKRFAGPAEGWVSCVVHDVSASLTLLSQVLKMSLLESLSIHGQCLAQRMGALMGYRVMKLRYPCHAGAA